jgi:hypothetical protein
MRAWRLLITLGTSAALTVPHALRAQAGGTPAVGAGRVAAQIVAGTVALPVGYVAGGLTTRWVARRVGASDDAASRAANVGADVGAALAIGGAVSLIGARAAGIGSFPAAVGGAALGGVASALVVRVARRPNDAPVRACRIGCVLASVLVVALPSVGATVAYDASRHVRR